MKLLLPHFSLLTICNFSDLILTKRLQIMNNLTIPICQTIQYNTASAITGNIRETSREKLYQDLRFESLKGRKRLKRI